MATKREKRLARRGFGQIGPGVYVQVTQRGKWMVGTMLAYPASGGVVRLQRAYPMAEAMAEAVAGEVTGCMEIGARLSRGVLRRFGKKFRKRVNNTARKIAALKVVKQLNVAKAKVLQSPLAGAGVAAAARALSAFGVPASVTKLALNQARFAAADRAAHGGTAALVARLSSGSVTDKAHRQAILKEIARRRVDALKQGMKASIPGANLAAMAKGGMSLGYDPYL